MTILGNQMTPAQSMFWTAIWAGMAAPIYVYAPINAYAPYGNPGGVGESFAAVGWQISGAFSSASVTQGQPVELAYIAR